MPITLGILAQSRQAVSAGAYELIESVLLSSAAGSVTFSGLSAYSSTYKHLQLRVVARGATASNLTDLQLRFNGDTAQNYVYHQLYGNGSSVVSEAYPSINQTTGALIPAANATANSFGGGVIDILDAYQTTKFKTIRGLSGYTANTNYVLLRSGLWRVTDAISSMTLFAGAGNLESGSRFSLYGIKGA